MPSHLNEYELATNPAVKEKITTLGRELNNYWSAMPALLILTRNFLPV
jgi:hypothetical protein